MNSIKEHVEYFGISGHVIGMSQDTTATNVGREKGTFRRYCQEMGTCLLRVDCRRHIVELEVQQGGQKEQGCDEEPQLVIGHFGYSRDLISVLNPFLGHFMYLLSSHDPQWSLLKSYQ